MRHQRRAFVVVVAVFGLALGCATNSDIRRLESRINELSAKIDTVDQRAQEGAADAKRAAIDGVAKAEAAALEAKDAAQSAASAATAADRAARTSEAIFNKTVRK